MQRNMKKKKENIYIFKQLRCFINFMFQIRKKTTKT